MEEPMKNRPKILTHEQTVSALGNLSTSDKRDVVEGAADVAIKTGLSTLDGLDILTLVGQYMALEEESGKTIWRKKK